MKINLTQILIIGTIVVGGGILLLLISQKGSDIESKYREIVDVFAVAKEVGLDEEQFKKDIDSVEVHNQVAESKKDAEKRLNGQISTPVIFLNGERYSDGGTIDELVNGLKREIDTKLAESEGKPLVEEFYDYNCIHCSTLEEPLRIAMSSFGDKIVFEKKQLPFLRTSSTTYAYAAVAAERQGKLTEFSQLLFKKIHNK